MPGFDAQFCQMLESEFLFIRKTLDLILVYPEQMADKIKSYCFRVANILFKAILDEINFWRDQILTLKKIITDSKFFKNQKRICADMMKCAKLFELVAGKSTFGNKTASELKANAETFEKYVCQGQLLEAAQALLNTAVATSKALITSVQTAMETWTTIQFNVFMAKYNALLKLYDIAGSLEKLDAMADCIFGVCNIGATVVNYKDDITTRLYLNANGQADRSKFRAILLSGINKIDDAVSGLEDDANAIQSQWHKVAKDTISHN